jgi:hypothetical protein
MKKLVVSLVILILILTGVLWIFYQRSEKAISDWEIAEGNVKAYCRMLSKSDRNNVALHLTIDQLEYFNDSVLQELNATRKELKVKDKNLKALQAVSSSFSRKDTITLRDTLFKEPSLNMDTLMGDKWYSLRLGLKYPSMIVVQPEFKSEKHIVVSTKKETVNPPKKFFLFRWFQKKQTLIHVDVVEKNPYVENQSSRYIEIMK